jgi:excisionase family DNA binding protein
VNVLTNTTADADLPAFLTAREIARLTRQSGAKVYDDIAKGRITAHRFGASVRIARADFEAYLAACRVRA